MRLDIVIQAVDRTPPDTVVVNTSVNLLYCPVRLPKAALAQLGYTQYRPRTLRPLVEAVVRRAVERNGGQVPLGGVDLDPAELEGLPPAPPIAP
ncbi:conserved protein of unknown function [Candidatus Hydrogenisulfobacillus filiaventi]|uniref:Uncharacterized protein n=1 Tax=Candidatus Hydrogenisulfobacillus filiaventi TaxID=2707344 RepID=A0A6F8ZE61_9FIRM|nr:hypothetical protein [Bacillota bacterium]CAB1127950.1 conserved protein of unknown function [Candidatus Hydrogenisulfobacillus filiaventi]